MEKQSKNMKQYLIPMIMLVVGLVAGWAIFSSSNQPNTTSSHQDINTSEVWTCSMHPSIRQSEPGSCPICGMDLIPLGSDEEGADPMEVKMSDAAMKLANVQTTTVGAGNMMKEVRLNGKVQADERRKSSQAAHIPGRIEQLLVNFTGEYVQRGQTIAQIYSPELVTAQQELLEANKIKDTQAELYAASRDKLKNWKLTDKQIDAILVTGKLQERFPLLADVSGIVLMRRVSVGDYVMRGAPIYDVADLSSLWILFDVYESDLQWVKTGSEVNFTIQSLPGEKFTNKISFVDPLIDPQTRVASARVDMQNPGLRLKPEMFVSGTVKSNLKGQKDIVVPKSAVMWTGQRSVVYVKHTTDAGVSFRMTEVTLGPSLGDAYVIAEGLAAGQEVVTSGTFTIDAAAQLAGKPSMMSPEGGARAGHNHNGTNAIPANEDHNQHQMGFTPFEVDTKFSQQLSNLLTPYLALKDAFVRTNAPDAAAASQKLKVEIAKVDLKLVKGEAHNSWMKTLEVLNNAVGTIGKSKDIEVQRKAFSELSNNYYDALQQFKVSGLEAYYQYCPMAFNNQGAYWISTSSQIQNPYFGDKMMRCGSTKAELK